MDGDAFDLIILDNWYVADGHGIDLCRRIRCLDPTTPILFYSANAVPGDIQRAFEAGAQAYLALPDTHRRLPEQVTALVQTAAANSITARSEEIRAIREQLGSDLGDLQRVLIQAGELLRDAQLSVIRTRAFLAFLKAGGTRANFDRLWPAAWREAAGVKSAPGSGQI
jgi:DNA-binding response OmpR family regulator